MDGRVSVTVRLTHAPQNYVHVAERQTQQQVSGDIWPSLCTSTLQKIAQEVVRSSRCADAAAPLCLAGTAAHAKCIQARQLALVNNAAADSDVTWVASASLSSALR